MSYNPAAILYDAAGNPIKSIQIGSDWLLGTASRVGDGTNWAAVKQDGSDYRLAVDTKEVQLTINISDFVKNGGSEDLRVDGSSTPVTFSYEADVSNNIVLVGFVFCMSATSVDLDGDSFASGNALSTGILVKTTINSGTVIELPLLKLNEDFLRLLEHSLHQGGVDDNMTGTFKLGGRSVLVAGSSDKIEVTVQDDLTAALLGLKYLTCTVYGYKE